MEVPSAKRARLAPRELKLLDLDDDALIMIVDKLDHRSKKQMMATCKRFESLIGHTHQFYKNFQFRYDQEEFLKSKETRYLEKARRRFGIVEICSGANSYSNRKISLKSPSLEFLKKIGAHILKIKFDTVFFFKPDFWKLMKTLPKVEEMEMKHMYFPSENQQIDVVFEDFELQELTKLDISASSDLEPFGKFIPASLKILKICGLWSQNWDAEALGKLKSLVELNLRFCRITGFNFDPENCHIEKLEIRLLEFPNGSAFEKFSDFMKIQESVTELELLFSEEEIKNHDYKGLLEHLFNLKSLKKLIIDYRHVEISSILSKLKACNPTVDTLTILKPPSGTDFKIFPKFFPNVSDLKITWKYHENDFIRWDFLRDLELNVKPINSMKKIRKLEIDYLSEEMLAQLDLNQLQEIYVSRCTNYVGLARDGDDLELVNLNWRSFISSHSQLKILHMSCCCFGVEQLQIALENLPLLTSLELMVKDFNYGFATDFAQLSDDEFMEQYKKEQSKRTAQLIGEKYDHLEHLKLNFPCWNSIIAKIRMSEYLEQHHPGASLYK
jgi:hypothetical protein